MKKMFFPKLQALLSQANQWLLETPERSLDQAYKAALMIKAIEDEHFDGKKISTTSSKYTDSVISYFQADLKKYLTTAKIRLAEFKASRAVTSLSEESLKKLNLNGQENQSNSYALEFREKPSVVIEKLNFVDEIINKYTTQPETNPSTSLVAIQKVNVVKVDERPIEQNRAVTAPTYTTTSPVDTAGGDADTFTDKSGVLPRSIGRTFERIQRELDPKAEDQVIQNFRSSRQKTLISVRFLLIYLIIIPILTQQLSKNLLVGPIVDHFRNPEKTEIFLNLDLEEEALRDLQRFEEVLKFKSLIGLAPELSKEEMEEKIKGKADEIKEEYRDRSTNAIKNVFADTIALITFCLVIVVRKRDLEVLKSFMDEIVYGLSDSAKAFIIILFTDIFVGFHSPHGWEVLLEGISKHLGLPENREFIFLFIATFPVILDTIFKYWIFRYLSRMSPSAVATYRNMNE